MTIRQIRWARNRKPIGLAADPTAPKPPGPLGLRPVVFASPKQQIQAIKKLKMPSPARDAKTKLARDVSWPLFKKKDPDIGDLQQGALHNCPLVSLLAALANTNIGRKHIRKLVMEHKAVTETDLSGVVNELDSTPASKKITTNRYFKVKLGSRSYEVSSVLYTDDADRNWSPIYMGSPTEVLWPCLIEKAYAKKEGGYGQLDSAFGKGLTLNEIWKTVVGSDPQGFKVDDKTKSAEILAAARAAKRIPTVAASKLKLGITGGAAAWHGYVVLGVTGSKIKLYDPMKLKNYTFSLKEFSEDFEAVLYGGP